MATVVLFCYMVTCVLPSMHEHFDMSFVRTAHVYMYFDFFVFKIFFLCSEYFDLIYTLEINNINYYIIFVHTAFNLYIKKNIKRKLMVTNSLILVRLSYLSYER